MTPPEDYRLIPLTQGQFAKVSPEDFENLVRLNWCASWEHCSFYARAWDYSERKRVRVAMHRVVLGCLAGDGKQVDHRNGDGLDNRRTNLRLVTTSQNAMNRKLKSSNSSGHRGITWHDRDKWWRAQIMIQGKTLWVGSFQSLDLAIEAVNSARKTHFGEFARTL
jgi:hypothetical protein